MRTSRGSSSTALFSTLLLALGLSACEGGRTRTPGTPPGSNQDAGITSDAGANADGGVPSGACTRNVDCNAGVCDRLLGRCVSCRTSDECATSESCEAGRCVAAAACQSDLECTPMGKVCDTQAGRCVACNSSADCGDKACLGHSCVDNPACQSSLDCAEIEMVCAPALPPAWPESFMGQGCAECGSANDCSAQEGCVGGFCTDICGERICGTVDGVECGSCGGQALCAADGMACVSALPAQFEAEAVYFDQGRALLWRDGRSSGGAHVWSIDLAGDGTTTSLYVGLGGLPYLDGVTVAGGRVFAALTDGSMLSGTAQGRLTPFTNVPGVGNSDSVWCQGLAGHSAYVVCDLVDYDETVTSGLYRFPVDGQAPSLIDTIVQASGIFVEGDEVIWSDFNGAQIGKSQLLTGQRTVLARTQGDLLGVAGGYVYLRNTNNELQRINIAGGSPEFVTDEPSNWRQVTVAEDRLFLVSRGESATIYEADLDGGNLRSILEIGGIGLPVDGSSVLGLRAIGADLFLVTRYGVAKISR